MRAEVKTSYAASQILMEIILECGISPRDFKSLTGVNRSQINDPDAWIPMTSFIKLWQEAIRLTKDPALALHLRKETGLRMVHFVVQLAMHSSTLLEALFHLSQYAGLMSQADKFELSDNGEMIEIIYKNTVPKYQTRWIPEHNFSLGVELGRTLSIAGKDFNPVQANFQHSDPGYKYAYEEVFCSPVLFQQHNNSLLFFKKDLMHPISTRDPYLQKVLKNYAKLSMDKTGTPESLQAQIIELITVKLPLGDANIKTIAKKVNMTRNTLYRKLKEEGTTFQKILLKTRQEIAKNHLRNGMSSSQVAYLIGFSEPAAFSHAFKRWFNISSGEYRKSL